MLRTASRWTIDEIRNRFDWSHTMPDMRDRVTRAIASQQDVIAACTGSLDRCRTITWCDNGYMQLDAGNFRFDAGGWAGDEEDIIAARIS